MKLNRQGKADMKSHKVILDTNIWISFLITKNYTFLDDYIESGKVKLIFSKELIQEFLTVSLRQNLRKYFTEDDIENLLLIFNNFGILINVTSNIKLCRDSKDDFLLNLAVDSKADYLVTGDNDLLVIGKIKKTKILTIKELKEHL